RSREVVMAVGKRVSPRELVRTAADGVTALRVLSKRGMINPLQPAETLRTMRDSEIYGPFTTVLRHAVRVHGEKPAVVDERGTLTFAELDRLSDALARGLAAAG